MAGLARGKIIYGDSGGNPAALAIGSNGTVLKSDGTDVSWGTVAGGVSNFATGTNNTAAGTEVFNDLDSGAEGNVGVGYRALYESTHANSDFNTAVGYRAGSRNENGGKNTFVGADAGRNTTSNFNVAVGYFALKGMRPSSSDYDVGVTGSSNTAVGPYCNRNTNSQNYGTFLGFNAQAHSVNSFVSGDYNVVLGANATTASTSTGYSITLGHSDITSLRCQQTSISSLSDRRDKTNIIDSPYGLTFLNSIRPVQFTWKRRKLLPHEFTRTDKFNGVTRLGFIAQELQAAQDAVSNTTKDIVDLVLNDNPRRLEAKQGNMIPVLVKAVQELSAKVDALTTRVTALE